MSSATGPGTPAGPGSVSGAPDLPAGFADTFTSRYVFLAPYRSGPAAVPPPRSQAADSVSEARL